MEELYSVMEGLLELEYKQKAFIQMLQAAEVAYSLQEEQEKMRMLTDSAKWQMESCKADVRHIIRKLDEYIARNASLRK